MSATLSTLHPGLQPQEYLVLRRVLSKFSAKIT